MFFSFERGRGTGWEGALLKTAFKHYQQIPKRSSCNENGHNIATPATLKRARGSLGMTTGRNGLERIICEGKSKKDALIGLQTEMSPDDPFHFVTTVSSAACEGSMLCSLLPCPSLACMVIWITGSAPHATNRDWIQSSIHMKILFVFVKNCRTNTQVQLLC